MRKLESTLIHLVALHSYLVGAMLTFAPAWSTQFAGFGEVPDFFARQAGVFHFVLASAYLIEYRGYDGVFTLVLAKVIATVFLFSYAFFAPAAGWAVLFSAFGDAAMGVAVVLMRRVRGRAEARTQPAANA
jgi:hypothetical protein